MDTIADTTGHDAFGFVHVEFEGTLDVADTALNFNSLDIDGNYLYAVGDSIFATISILDPLAPVCSSEYVIPGVNNLILEDVEVRGNFAFLVGGIITPGGGSDGILIVLNIGKPKEPTYVSSFIKRGTPTENHYFTAIDLEGNVAYVVDSFSNFYSIDITNYTTMSEIGNVAIDPGGHDLMVDGNWAYIACSHSIFSVDVTTPGVLTVGDIVGPIDYVGDLYVDGDWLYVVCGDGTGYGLWKYDITDPTSITYYSSDYWYDCAIPYGVSIMGDWGYIMGYKLDNSTHPDTFSTIGVFDVMDKVKFVCSFNFMRELMRRLHKNGETMLYTVGRYFDGSGFVGAARAIRVGYPDSCVFEPGEIRYYSIFYGHPMGNGNHEPSQIEIRGDFAFIVDEVGMAAVNIKRPDSMYFTGEFVDSNHIYWGINVSGNSAFLTSTGPDTTFWIIDVTIPAPIWPPFSLPIRGVANVMFHDNIYGEVKIEGNYAYTFTLDCYNGGGLWKIRGILDEFNITYLDRPVFISNDTMLCCLMPDPSPRIQGWWLYNSRFGELQIEGDTVYVSWRAFPYHTGVAAPHFPDSADNHIGFFDISNISTVKSFIPYQHITPMDSIPHNLGFARHTQDPSGDDYGGAIDVEGNILYSTIGKNPHNYKPVATSLPKYGLLRYSIDTTWGGSIYGYSPASNECYQSKYIEPYLPLTESEKPLELYIDGDFLFCSFDRDSLYYIKIDSVNGYMPKYGTIPIYRSSFNDFKTNGDYLYAVGESLLTAGYRGMLWSIRVYRRNHLVPPGSYAKRIARGEKNSSLKKRIVAYPNPFNKSVKIAVNLLQNNNYRLEIIDISGRVVWSYDLNEKISNEIIEWQPAEHINSGIYIMKLTNNKFTYYEKLLFVK